MSELKITMPDELYELIKEAAEANFEDIGSWCRRVLYPKAMAESAKSRRRKAKIKKENII